MLYVFALQGNGGGGDSSPGSPSSAAATWAGTPGRVYSYGELAAATQVGGLVGLFAGLVVASGGICMSHVCRNMGMCMGSTGRWE